MSIVQEKILTGEVKRSQVLLTDALFNIYARNKRRIDDAFDIYAEGLRMHPMFPWMPFFWVSNLQRLICRDCWRTVLCRSVRCFFGSLRQ